MDVSCDFIVWQEGDFQKITVQRFNSLPLGELDTILKTQFSILFYGSVSSDLYMMMP